MHHRTRAGSGCGRLNLKPLQRAADRATPTHSCCVAIVAPCFSPLRSSSSLVRSSRPLLSSAAMDRHRLPASFSLLLFSIRWAGSARGPDVCNGRRPSPPPMPPLLLCTHHTHHALDTAAAAARTLTPNSTLVAVDDATAATGPSHGDVCRSGSLSRCAVESIPAVSRPVHSLLTGRQQ